MYAVHSKKSWLFILCVILVSPGWAQSESSLPVTIGNLERLTADQLVAWVLQQNPGVTELTAAAEAAVYRIEPAGSLTDPTFGYAFAPNTFGRAGQGLNQKIELSQSIPWPGTLAAREDVARQEAAAAAEDVDALRLRLAALARSAYAEWYFVHRALAIHNATYNLLDELRAVAETRYAAGRALQQDVLQAEVEQMNLERHGLKLQRIKASIQAQINALLNQHPETPLPQPAEIVLPKHIPSLVELESRALEGHPELKRLDALIAANTAQVTVAEKAFLPDLRFVAGYNSLWDEVDKRLIVGVSINVPLARSKRKAALSTAKADLRRVQARLANQRTQLLGELARSRAEVLESIEAVKLYETSLLPLANEYFGAAVGDYRSGAGSFLSVITAEQRKFVTEEQLERNRSDTVRRMAELERWVGTPLNIPLALSKEINHGNN